MGAYRSDLPFSRTLTITMIYRSTLFVSNLPYTATSTDLKTLFSDIAPVRTAFVVLEQGTGHSKGVGYVSFAIREDAAMAIDKISKEGITLDGRSLRVQWAGSKVCAHSILHGTSHRFCCHRTRTTSIMKSLKLRVLNLLRLVHRNLQARRIP